MRRSNATNAFIATPALRLLKTRYKWRSRVSLSLRANFAASNTSGAMSGGASHRVSEPACEVWTTSFATRSQIGTQVSRALVTCRRPHLVDMLRIGSDFNLPDAACITYAIVCCTWRGCLDVIRMVGMTLERAESCVQAPVQ